MSFSNSGAGGTLTVPSPTHVHHVDVLATSVRSLRRSLSRSPSKFSLARTGSQSSESSRSSYSPAEQSPSRRYSPSISLRSHAQSHTPGQQSSQLPLLTPRSSAFSTTPQQPPPTNPYNFSSRPNSGLKLSLRSARSTAKQGSTSSRQLTRLRGSPKSPLKRTHSATDDTENALPAPSSTSASAGQDTPTPHPSSTPRSPLPRSSLPRRPLEKSSRHSLHLDVSGSTQRAIFKALEGNAEMSGIPGSGALKRSDALMDVDQPSLSSPVAKRRSLHGVSGVSTIANNDADVTSIFGGSTCAPNTSFEIHDDGNRGDYELSSTSSFIPPSEALPSPTPVPSIPRRTGSLRKSTLQQRQHDRSSWGRRSAANHLAQMGSEFSTPNVKNRPRLSLDQFCPPQLGRDSPFSNISFPAAPVQPDERGAQQQQQQQQQQPHPLSKSLTTSSSGNNLQEEDASSKDKVPPAIFARPVAPINFARSLPCGLGGPPVKEDDTVTPFKDVKPWPGAFMSTGLVSKVNRNPEEDNKLVMPDTPCKKPNGGFATYPPPPGSAFKRNAGRLSFGVPSSPFSPSTSQQRGSLGNAGKGLGLFHRLGPRSSSRRSSLLSLDGEDKKLMFDTLEDAPSGIDADDVPPTPTKQSLTSSLSSLTETSAENESPSANRTILVPLSAVRPMIPRESTGKCDGSPEGIEPKGDCDGSAEAAVHSAVSSDCGPSPPPRLSLPSLAGSRSRRGFHSSSPLRARLGSTTPLNSAKKMFAKAPSRNAASPVERRSPTTPQPSLAFPDASVLSISTSQETGSAKSTEDQSVLAAPVTPSGRDSFHASGTGLMTPVNARARGDDESLLHRFDRVELVGKGEFSMVYKVVKSASLRASFLSIFNGTPGRTSPGSPEPDRIYAVKKGRRPILGPKDRENKLREVRALQALTHADHVVRYVDSWEHDSYLFIQTEFCDEGSLDKFLGNVGRKGRLDDFRIWKITHDICLGLQSIHEAGFIHLDLKPANVFITFEGILKIGDFGLATPWPAAKGVDAEGDREYIGPEILRGKFDKPADIFSLGLIMVEMACNVVLPDNGPSWIALRSGDFSEVPSLTFSATTATQARDAAGVPTGLSQDEPIVHNTSTSDFALHEDSFDGNHGKYAFGDVHISGSSGSRRRPELQTPPDFMCDSFHPHSLDQLVRWMTKPDPSDRPTIQQLLGSGGLNWVAERRRAAATVFEGIWGPADDANGPEPSSRSDEDTEMTDMRAHCPGYRLGRRETRALGLRRSGHVGSTGIRHYDAMIGTYPV
ncbi:hypothetical protein SODALDRAFT_361437 [Sodiomyces alkalinus F11]|uniref:Protein kinase domain-containing protein n=1 Tax=Sodiomyces alkalinus (strain CBS 110278 / VKM F-3762 / F11) TaxID=1314773 RepID=A0A3N2PT68_SODAK|nr:hypothetical protein SODALDRAFT_361437 [Sodiomyces alkalinus F11]ROT37707.1 hypothetical protein SODALDRAFT_361437 [Sodiomyces alkalinus F11]